MHLLYASALFKTNKESLCLSYADSALQIFQSRYKTKPCLKIHVLLGSCYSRARDFPSALSNYEQAKELAELLNQDVDIGIIEHNIATTKYRMNNKKEAINLLKEAMKHKKNNNIRFLTSLNMLLNIYYEMDYTREIRCLLKEYSHLPSKLSRETIQVKEFLFFLFFLSKPQNEWEAYVTNEFYPFLQTKKENRQLINYTKIIANYYENNGSYKNATYYFKRALEISEHTNNL
ncbi:tetratricopeptide repeat protein [Halobacillus andaensis]|uniref:tetratricopeptide repeat protein n=1 Tax=Halobacillus andaensis TaxID=1176239 RepID=UPI003D70EA04